MKKILLTGASKGIGKSILKKLMEANDNCIYVISQNIEKIDPKYKEKIKLYDCDLSNIIQVQKTIKEILKDSKGIDILINNAGIGKFNYVENFTIEEWNEVLSINLTVPFLLIKNVLPSMKEKNNGKIINISSDASHMGFSEGSLYCASKFGLRGFTDSLRKEVIGQNIAITNISPGRVDTNFNNKKEGDRPNSLSADDIAKQVIFVINQRERCEIEEIILKSTLE